MTTSLPPGACLVEAHFPIWHEPSVGVGFHEVSARKSDFAYVAAAGSDRARRAGPCARSAVGIGGATPCLPGSITLMKP